MCNICGLQWLYQQIESLKGAFEYEHFTNNRLKEVLRHRTQYYSCLNGVNFTVEQGEFVAVVGTSGSGKSTLLHMMGGLDTPTSGSVIVRGEELAKKNDDELTIFRRRNIGLFSKTTIWFRF